MSEAYAVGPRDVLVDALRSRIVNGELKPGAKLETVRALAATLGHAQATVVRAIEQLVDEGYLITRNRTGTYVSPREAWVPAPRNFAVLTGVPTQFSAGLLTDSTHLGGIGVLQKLIETGGNRVSLHGCVHYPEGPVIRRFTRPRNLALDKMDAIVAAGIYELAYLGALLELEIPVIAYDVDASALRMDSVFIDDVDSAFNLTAHFLRRGHRKIAFIGGPLNSPRREQLWNYDPSHALRADGYALAMRQHGLEAAVFRTDWVGQDRGATARILNDIAQYTAVLVIGPFDLKLLKSRKLDIAHWISGNRAPDALPAGVAAAAFCDQDAMGRAAMQLLERRLADASAAIERRAIRTQIIT